MQKGEIFINTSLTKDEFLNIQSKLYDSIQYALKNNTMIRFDYELIDRGIFYTLPKGKRNYTANINMWLDQIQFAYDNLFEEIIILMSYSNLYDESKDGAITRAHIFTTREQFFRLVCYDLFSLREKLSFLIYNTFNRNICKKSKGNFINLNKRDVSFNTILIGLDYIDLESKNITGINNDEFILIKDVLNKNFSNLKVKSFFNEFRNSYSHRHNVSVGYMPARSFEFQPIDSTTRKILLSMDRKNGVKDAHKLSYINLSPTPLNKKYNYDTVISDVVYIFNEFTIGFKILLTNISIIKEEIISFV